jgi:hypothetical protein
MNVATNVADTQKKFISFREAAARLGCTRAGIKELVLAGELACINRGHDPDRILMTTSLVWAETVDRLASERGVIRETPKQEVLEANYTLGDNPGCGACLCMCQVCRQIQTRVRRCMQTDQGWHGPTWFLTDYEAYLILGFNPKGGPIAFLRKHKVAIVSKPNRWDYKVAWDGLIRVKQQLVLQSIDVRDERRGIVTALDQMIDLRRREMAELDAALLQYSVGPEQPMFRYGRVVIQSTPPKGLWYVYHLCYPIGRPFYVGKGIGSRMYQHEKEALGGVESYKCRVIRRIKSKGQQICYRVVFITPDEKEAYEYEVLEIARIGLNRLTNVNPGGLTWEERDRVLGSGIPNRQRNYTQFTRILDALNPPPSQEERRVYLRNWACFRISELKRLRTDAWALSHDEAIRKIDAEIDLLRGYAAEQLSFAHLEKYHDRPYSPWYRGRADDY